jgi:hypothetical protein
MNWLQIIQLENKICSIKVTLLFTSLNSSDALTYNNLYKVLIIKLI